MSFVIHVKNKKNGSVYAYSVENYRDPVTKEYRQHRTYIGKVSPTGEIIPKKETSHHRKVFEKTESHVAAPSNENTSLNEVVNELSKRMDRIQNQNRVIIETMQKVAEVISSIQIP